MTTQDLLNANFKPYKPSVIQSKYVDMAYQLKVKDKDGIKYFIDVLHFPEINFYENMSLEAFEASINYGEGLKNSKRCCLELKIYSIKDWAVFDLIKFAEDMWNRLEPNYYEKRN